MWKVPHDEFTRARSNLFDLAEVYSDHPDYRWGGVLVIDQQAIDEAAAWLSETGPGTEGYGGWDD